MTATTTDLSIRVGSAVLIESGTHHPMLLLGQRGKEPNYGSWVIPGGGVHLFESIDAAAVREASEETGLKIEVTGRVGVFEIIDPPEHRVIVFSRARRIGGTLSPSSDLLDARWFNRREINARVASPFQRSVLIAAGWLTPDIADGAGL